MFPQVPFMKIDQSLTLCSSEIPSDSFELWSCKGLIGIQQYLEYAFRDGRGEDVRAPFSLLQVGKTLWLTHTTYFLEASG